MWSLIVHGGAGVIDPSNEASHRSGCMRAVEAGRPILEAGGSALDACCAAVRVLEDDPVFNAGIGAVLDRDGTPALDASVMRGSDLAYGAVACVVGVRHPIDLARAVLEDGKHCLLVGAGAIEFARDKQIELCDPALMITERSRISWEKLREGDTVGAIARDASGALAVATSTGGTYLRWPGRVGDTPIAGAGSYARSDLGALAATGHGETMMRTVFAYSALRALAEAGAEADPVRILERELEAAAAVAGGRGGAIAVLPDGRVVWARNTPHMGVAWARAGEAAGTAF